MAAGQRTPLDTRRYPGLVKRDSKRGVVWEHVQWNSAEKKSIRRPLGVGLTQKQAIEAWEKQRPEVRQARGRSSKRMTEIADSYFARVDKRLARPTQSRDPRYGNRRRRGIGSQATRNQYFTDWEKYVEPAFGKMYAHQIEAEDVLEWLDWLWEQPGRSGDTFSGSTVNGKLTVLRVLLNEAQLQGAVDFDVFRRIRPEDLPDQAPRESYDANALRIPELLKLIAAADDEHKRNLIVVLAYTGMRRAEVVALQWGEVAVAEKMLKLAKSLAPLERGQDARRIDLKGKWKRTVVTLPRTVEAFGSEWATATERGFTGDRDYVFTSDIPGRPHDPSYVTDIVKEAAEAAGLEGVTPRTLRRTTATIFALAKIPPHLAARMLGHSPEVYDKNYVQQYRDLEEHEGIIEALGLLGFGDLEEEA